jgi:hypothetical protein
MRASEGSKLTTVLFFPSSARIFSIVFAGIFIPQSCVETNCPHRWHNYLFVGIQSPMAPTRSGA